MSNFFICNTCRTEIGWLLNKNGVERCYTEGICVICSNGCIRKLRPNRK